MITSLDPTADGTYTAWTASAGNKWACVDDGAAANDADYIYRLGTGQQTFTCSDLPSGAVAVSTITVTARMKRDNGDYADGAINWVSGGSRYGTTKTILGSAYRTETDTKATDPNGGGEWTVSRVNGMEIGCDSFGTFAGSPDFEQIYCSWLKADVTHQMPAGGFLFLVGSLVGAAVGIEEIWRLARAVYSRTRSLIEPSEYTTVWRALRDAKRRSISVLGFAS